MKKIKNKVTLSKKEWIKCNVLPGQSKRVNRRKLFFVQFLKLACFIYWHFRCHIVLKKKKLLNYNTYFTRYAKCYEFFLSLVRWEYKTIHELFVIKSIMSWDWYIIIIYKYSVVLNYCPARLWSFRRFIQLQPITLFYPISPFFNKLLFKFFNLNVNLYLKTKYQQIIVYDLEVGVHILFYNLVYLNYTCVLMLSNQFLFLFNP